jgi:hypothetical protein
MIINTRLNKGCKIAGMPRRLPSEVLDYFRKEGAKGGKTSSQRMTTAARQARAAAAGRASGAARRAKKKAARS